MGIDRRSQASLKLNFGIAIGQVQAGLEERADSSDVFPISLKDIGLNPVFLDGGGNDVLTEIGEVIVQAFDKNVAFEDVDSHRRLIKIGVRRLADGLEEIRRDAQVVENLGILWLFDELDDPALSSVCMIPKPVAAFRSTGIVPTVRSAFVSTCWRRTSR